MCRREVSLTYQILSDSTGRLQGKGFNFIRQEVGDDHEEVFRTKLRLEQADVRELATRLGRKTRNNTWLHYCLFRFLCLKVNLREQMKKPHFWKVCDGDTLYKRLAESYATAGAAQANRHYKRQSSDY